MDRFMKRLLSIVLLVAVVASFGTQVALAATGPVIAVAPSAPETVTDKASPEGSAEGDVEIHGLTDWVLRASLLFWYSMMRLSFWHASMMFRIRQWCSAEAAAFIETNWIPLGNGMKVIAELPVELTVSLVYDRIMQNIVALGGSGPMATSAANALKEAIISLAMRWL